MGRKSSKVNTSQPTRTFYSSSSGSSAYRNNNTPSNHPSTTATPATPSTATTTNSTAIPNGKPSLGDTIKQGMATGLGFGLANAAIGSIASSFGSQNSSETVSSPSYVTPPNNSCEFLLNQYTHCLKTQANLMEDNCEYFLAQFKTCQVKKSSATQEV
tara:strand:+ start:309 stop:782 length:474 start_codon:yes stop_codon:yes gene_type:complete